jgi:hypothetical protein
MLSRRALAATFNRAIRAYPLSRKYSPDQPRVPSGSREGGQWTTGSGGSPSDARAENSKPVRPGDASRPGSRIMSDASPDPIRPGARYAQSPINIETSALTGISRIDDTTMALAKILAHVKDTVAYVPGLSPQQYGTAVHVAFAAAVKAAGLPGIASSDVETTWGGDYYGAKGSVRTDVVLRNDAGDVIAIYDVKTGRKGIEPARAAELRLKVGVGNDVKLIQLSFEAISFKSAFFGSVSIQTVFNDGVD